MPVPQDVIDRITEIQKGMHKEHGEWVMAWKKYDGFQIRYHGGKGGYQVKIGREILPGAYCSELGAIQDAQHRVHPTAAGVSASGDNSESGGG